MPQTLHERVYHTSSGNVFYWIDASADTDAPWLVFLPGLTADHTMFDAQMAYFSGKANCLVWDAPAHGKSRPYPLDFSMDDCARILHAILEAESIKNLVLVGQSVGGYVAQAFIDLHPREAAGFVSIDSAPLKRKYYSTWEVKALRHTKGMYQFVPKEEYVELAAHGYKMLADAVESRRAYNIDCPALLLCGEKDHAGDVKVFNRKWAAGEKIPLVWIPGAGHNSNVDNPSFVNSKIEQLMVALK